MKTNLIKEIWEIRGEIDKAIENQDIQIYNKAHKRFMKLLENQEHQMSYSTISVNKSYNDLDEMYWDRECNFSIITFEIGKLKENILGKYWQKSVIQFSSVLEVVWFTREMYDNYIQALNNNIQNDELDDLRKSIAKNINACCGFYRQIQGGKTTFNERVTLCEIYNEFIKNYGDENEHKI